MTVRLMEDHDLLPLNRIHKEFYEKEFAFPFNGDNKLLDKYVITDEKGEIITFGALELSLEAIVITNKLIDVRERREAFHKLLHCLQFCATRKGFNSFHATAQENVWAKQLIKRFGFKECKGKFLYLEV